MKGAKPLSTLILGCAALTAFAQTPAEDGLRQVQEFREGYGPELSAEVKAGKTLAQILETMNGRIKAKAEEVLAGLDTKTIAAKDAYAFAQLYSLAAQPKMVTPLVGAYLGTRPAPGERFAAEQLEMDSLKELGDGRGLEQILRSAKPVGTGESLDYASRMSGYMDVVANSRAQIRLLDLASERLDFSDLDAYVQLRLPKYKAGLLRSHQKDSSYVLPPDSELAQNFRKGVEGEALDARFKIVAKEAELLEKEGNLNAARERVKSAIKTIPTNSSVFASAKSFENHLELSGNPAPALKIERQYGDFTSLKDLQGKVVLIDSFAHWCGPCKAEFPAMRKMYDDLRDKGLEIVGVTGFYGFFESERGLSKDAEFARMADFRTQHGIDWPLVFDDSTNSKSYGITAFPTAVLIGRDGRVRSVDVGYSPDLFAKLRAEVEKALAEK